MLNVIAFVVFMGPRWCSATSGRAGSSATRSSAGSWRRGLRPTAERDLALRQPILVAGIAATFWALAAILFAAVNATVSAEVAAAAAVIALLGGATTCAIAYLLASESAGRSWPGPSRTDRRCGRPPPVWRHGSP